MEIGDSSTGSKVVLKRVSYRKQRVPAKIELFWQLFPEKRADLASHMELLSLVKERHQVGYNRDEEMDEAMSIIEDYTQRQSEIIKAFNDMERRHEQRDSMHHRLPRGSAYRGVKTYVPDARTSTGRS